MVLYHGKLLTKIEVVIFPFVPTYVFYVLILST